MLYTIVVILVVLWALGLVFGAITSYPIIHALLVIAVIVLIYQLVTGRRAL